jgi:Na+-driven multidrug efflux pump
MIREIVFGVGFALVLPLFFGLNGVLYSMPVSDFLTFVIAAVLIVRTYRELGAGEAEESAAALQKRSAGSAQMI